MKKLKEKYKNAKTKEEKEKIIKKLRKIAPYLPLDQILR
ncbi:MAG: DUF6800 family protein [Minisyncoccia bacterium]